MLELEFKARSTIAEKGAVKLGEVTSVASIYTREAANEDLTATTRE
jgi:hypothetical protein